MKGFEVWKDIPNYEGLYQVSNKGNVRSLYQWNGHRYRNRKKPYKLAQSNTTTGYKKVELVKDGVKKSKKVHRLVAKAFIPKVKEKNLINHLDGNPINNKVDNLEWCTQSENMYHAYNTGLREKTSEENKDRMIEDYYKGMQGKDIGAKYGVDKSYIYTLLKERGLKSQGTSFRQAKYNIDRVELLKDLRQGKRNIDLAKKYNTNRHLIGVLKYNFKKEGKLL